MKVARRVALAALAGLALAAGVPARAAASPTPGGAVARLERGLRTTRSLEAGLEQTRYSGLLDDQEKSRGRLYLRRPGDARLEYDAPSPLVILKRGDTTYVYAASLAQVQVMPAHAAGLPLGWVLGSSLAEIRRLATVRAAGAEVEIVPRAGSGLPWAALRLGFPPIGDFPVRFVLENGGGDRVEIRLTGVRRNRGVPAARFAPLWPPGTRRVVMGS
jgi:outer membrane lipoprotein-sorting protein